MKSLDLLLEGVQCGRLELTTPQHRASVPDHARHVPHELVRRPNRCASAKITERGWSVSERLLRAIRDRRKKVLKEMTM